MTTFYGIYSSSNYTANDKNKRGLSKGIRSWDPERNYNEDHEYKLYFKLD